VFAGSETVEVPVTATVVTVVPQSAIPGVTALALHDPIPVDVQTSGMLPPADDGSMYGPSVSPDGPLIFRSTVGVVEVPSTRINVTESVTSASVVSVGRQVIVYV